MRVSGGRDKITVLGKFGFESRRGIEMKLIQIIIKLQL